MCIRDRVTLVPLLLIVAVSALKDLFEDLKRYKSDREENMKEVLILNKETQSFTYQNWQQLRVGDIVKIKKDEYFPADLFIIDTSEPRGTCYIETKNLDGETNLKSKSSIKEVAKHFPDEKALTTEKFLINYERPSYILYSFNGALYLQPPGGSRTSESVSVNNLVLRGCSLRNTEFLLSLIHI
eukprot:TRINITY_DN19789_c0_g2_i2.p1 TRINITY_DN19789_c0_g2~~TRINITY_DN19789_c0_g2_i2.p1  ORF type:complete len:198 (+),score=26.10 TRINITY_DN19789_c0_g2_i2:44-595(+)